MGLVLGGVWGLLSGRNLWTGRGPRAEADCARPGPAAHHLLPLDDGGSPSPEVGQQAGREGDDPEHDERGQQAQPERDGGLHPDPAGTVLDVRTLVRGQLPCELRDDLGDRRPRVVRPRQGTAERSELTSADGTALARTPAT